MANYNLIAKSTFTPFTFDELVAPYEKYQTLYDKERDRYDELAATASGVLSMIDKEKDPELYNQYSQYLDKVNQVGEILASGTLGEARQAGLNDLKRQFYKEGLPITQAYSLSQETKKTRESNPDRLYINPALKMSELMTGKRDDNTSVSKKDIIQHAIQANSTDIINDFMRGIEKGNLNVADIINKYQYNSEEDPFNIGDNAEAQNEAAVLYNDAVSSFVGDLLSKEYIPKAQREQMAWNKEKAYNNAQKEIKDTITISVKDGTKDVKYQARKVGDIWTIFDGNSWVPAATVTGAMKQINNSKASQNSDTTKRSDIVAEKFDYYGIYNSGNFDTKNFDEIVKMAPSDVPSNSKHYDTGIYKVNANVMKFLKAFIPSATYEQLEKDKDAALLRNEDLWLVWDHDYGDWDLDAAVIISDKRRREILGENNGEPSKENGDNGKTAEEEITEGKE